ncbi:MAG: MOP flippase family protein [Thermodesulfobacteriota bacterium]|nr:MOP flippase family protein [Thermodesulfobacteriota bacterium]
MSINLKQKAASGVRWTALNTACNTGIQIIQLAILCRLLDPTVFGVMAMVMVVMEFGNVFADVGLSSAIIQRKDPKKEELTTLYWVNVVVGFIIYGFIYLLTPFVTMVFGVEEIKSLLPVAALSFVISPFGVQFQTLFHKYLRFDIITKIRIISALFGMCVGVGCAFYDYGAWSLVWAGLGNVILRTGLFIGCGWSAKWRPFLHFKWSDTNGYLSFGLYRVGAMLANQFNSRIDQLLIGILMGPIALGYYNIAFRLVIEPIQKINPILTSVSFPLFSIIQDDTAKLKRGFLKMIRFLMSVNAPILIGLATVAPLAVPLLIGEKWIPSIPLVQILAFYALIRSLGNAGGSLIIAKGKADWTFYWNITLIIVIPPVVYFSSLEGQMVHIALALLSMQIILFMGHYSVFIRNLIGYCFSEYIYALGIPVILAFTMSGIVIICSYIIPQLALAISLSIQIGCGILTYVLLLWVFQRKLFYEFFELLHVS